MKSIQESFNYYQDVSNAKKKSLDELCADPVIASFMKKNGFTRKDMDQYWLELLNFKDDYPVCLNCKGIHTCPKKLIGFKRKLVIEDGMVRIEMEPCPYEQEQESNNRVLSHISTNLPKKLFADQIKELETKNPILLLNMLQFATGVKKDGIYLYGPTQSGKTKMMAYFAYYMANNGKEVAMYNVPNLMGTLKSSFNDDEINSNEILYKLKTVDLLILDDIGGENFSTWSRDEIISTIIEERVLSELPTFFTSVYSYEDLSDYYTNPKQKGDHIKVTKLIEKIKAVTTSIQS